MTDRKSDVQYKGVVQGSRWVCTGNCFCMLPSTEIEELIPFMQVVMRKFQALANNVRLFAMQEERLESSVSLYAKQGSEGQIFVPSPKDWRHNSCLCIYFESILRRIMRFSNCAIGINGGRGVQYRLFYVYKPTRCKNSCDYTLFSIRRSTCFGLY